MKQIKRLISCEDGATAIEYALIAAGIAIVILASVNFLGGSLVGTFDSIGCTLDPDGTKSDGTACTPASSG